MAHDIPRPNCERAHAFIAGTCSKPGCGLHIIAERSDGKAICEIVIGRDGVRDLLRLIHDEGLDL